MIPLYPDKAFYMFDKLIEDDGCLFHLITSEPEKLFQRLSTYQNYTGKAFYYWNKGRGLYRTDIPNIYAPHTGNILNALQHISISLHFGIYLFSDVESALENPIAQKIMIDIIQKSKIQKKILLFAGQSVQIPIELEDDFTVIKHNVGMPTEQIPEISDSEYLLY